MFCVPPRLSSSKGECSICFLFLLSLLSDMQIFFFSSSTWFFHCLKKIIFPFSFLFSLFYHVSWFAYVGNVLSPLYFLICAGLPYVVKSRADRRKIGHPNSDPIFSFHFFLFTNSLINIGVRWLYKFQRSSCVTQFFFAICPVTEFNKCKTRLSYVSGCENAVGWSSVP